MVAFDQFHRIANTASIDSTLYLVGKGASQHVSLSPKDSSLLPHGRSWEVFLRSAYAQFGANKVQEIFSRYAINPQYMVQQGMPLLSKHVHMLEVGASCLRREDLQKYVGSSKNLASMSPSQLQQVVHKHVPVPCNRLRVAPFRLSGAPSTTSAFFFHDSYLIDQELQLLFSDVGNLPNYYAYLERLCKAISPRELTVGAVIPAPHPSGQKGALDYYEVYDVITTGDGLVAYALKPLSKASTLEPTIVFRGSPYHLSANDVLETWLNNVQKNIGWLGYQSSRGKLAKLMHDSNFCPANKRVTVTGFSLGGAHAQLFIADHPERVATAVFFNDPAIDEETADMFAAKINDTKKLPGSMKVRIFRTKGDVVHYAGGKHLFCGVHHPQVDIRLTQMKPKDLITTRQSHGWRNFDRAIPGQFDTKVFVNPKDLDRELDNAKRGEDVLWYERARLVLSYFVFPLFYVWSRILHFIEDNTGLAVLRHSKPRT